MRLPSTHRACEREQSFQQPGGPNVIPLLAVYYGDHPLCVNCGIRIVKSVKRREACSLAVKGKGGLIVTFSVRARTQGNHGSCSIFGRRTLSHLFNQASSMSDVTETESMNTQSLIISADIFICPRQRRPDKDLAELLQGINLSRCMGV